LLALGHKTGHADGGEPGRLGWPITETGASNDGAARADREERLCGRWTERNDPRGGRRLSGLVVRARGHDEGEGGSPNDGAGHDVALRDEPILVQLLDERRPRHAQPARRLALVVARGLEGLRD